MDVQWIEAGGARMETWQLSDVPHLLTHMEGFVWIDLPETTPEEMATVAETFGLDPIDVDDCTSRSLVPKVEVRPTYAFFILHTLDDEGHLLELDSFLGDNFLITVHGPLTPGVPLELALIETRATLEKLESGKFHPPTVDHLVTDIISGIEATLENLLFRTAAKAGALDRRAREGDTGAPEEFLEELFHVRHGLVTVRNRSGQSKQACHALAVHEPSEVGKELFEDLERKFERLTGLCDGEREFVQGVLDFFESITNTRMNAALSRLSLISFVILPASALIGFFGISSISYSQTSLRDTLLFAGFLLLLTLATLRWTKSKGWW